MIPSRMLGFQLNRDAKIGDSMGSTGITRCITQSASLGSLAFANSTGPPLQMVVSGWTDSDIDGSKNEAFLTESLLPDRKNEMFNKRKSSDLQNAVMANCSHAMPAAMSVKIEPPTSSEDESCSPTSAFDAPSVYSGATESEFPSRIRTSCLASQIPLSEKPRHEIPVQASDSDSDVMSQCGRNRLPSRKYRRKSSTALSLLSRPVVLRSQSVTIKPRMINIEPMPLASSQMMLNGCDGLNSATLEPFVCVSQKGPSSCVDADLEEIHGISVSSSQPDGEKRRQVYLCVIFLKIGEIDTIKEQYAADVLIKAKWRETEMDAAETVVSGLLKIVPVVCFFCYILFTNIRRFYLAPLEYDWMKSWSPKLYIENTIGETREQLHRIITFNEFGHAFLVEKRRVSGVFLENLELNHFPFDVQDLTITIASNLPSSEIRLVNDPDEPHRINKQSFVDEQEWYLYKHIETEQHELANEYEEHASAHPTLSVKCRAARRPAYFIWNIFLVTGSCLTTFFLLFRSHRDPEN
ncbi:unnamed protein product [Mesocestoides corti]|uniref:Neurotransmitter-gated ion-channel ligand-binding domain-containing protein n=1 Tax=Mesocestoides corti TaxID=53468 RepID=A0A0R3UE81_MESCO|nr:unnamed protein product [Mesocestoides corti]